MSEQKCEIESHWNTRHFIAVGCYQTVLNIYQSKGAWNTKQCFEKQTSLSKLYRQCQNHF